MGIQNPGLPNSTSWAWSDSNEICPCFYALHGSVSQGRLGGQSRCSYLWYCNGVGISISFLGCFLKSPALLKMWISFIYSFSAQNKVPKKPSHISEVLPLLCDVRQSHVQPKKTGCSSAGPTGRLLFPTSLLFLAQRLQSPPSTEGHTSHLGEVPPPSDIHRKAMTLSSRAFQDSRLPEIHYKSAFIVSEKHLFQVLNSDATPDHSWWDLNYFPAARTHLSHRPKSTSPPP